MTETNEQANNAIESSTLLECPNCQDGLELRHDGADWYEAECSMCGGTGTLNQKKSDGLRKLRACYQKTRQSNRAIGGNSPTRKEQV